MLKVAVILPSFKNLGPEIVARNIAEYSTKDIEFIFVSLRKNSDKDIKAFSRFEWYELSLGKIPLFSLKLKKIMKKIEPDIVHCHCFWPTVLVGIYLKKMKIISTLHNNPLEDFYYEYGRIISFLMIKIMIFFQKKFYINISISNYIKEVYEKLGLKNVVTIYNGVPEIKKLENLKIETESKKIKLITVSVLNKVKNVLFLLEVIKNLKESGKNLELKIIGNGVEKINLQTYMKENNLQDAVVFLGKLERNKVYEELKKADIFLFSSLSEGFGLVIAEALLANIPVVVGNIPVM
jgi:glycosyltransferase involved in cell wall biosynthesis